MAAKRFSMKPPVIALSHVVDGSMRDRSNADNPEVIRNRDKWLTALSIDPKKTTRVDVNYDTDDFCRYKIVDSAQMGEGMYGDAPENIDALVTTTPGQALFLPIADCIATVLYDSKHKVLMLSHLGRHSLEQDGAVRSVQFLTQEFQSDPKDIFVFMSPSANKEVYPIYKLGGKGMKEVAHEQLFKAGITLEHIYDDTADTVTDPTLYSYTTFLKGDTAKDGCHALVAQLPLQ